MSGVNEIRSTFLEYFRKAGHEVLPSSPLVPRNDPTLMFANSGMVQFKNVFTGAEKRPYNTATTAQKCVRAGGKHNDLDNVGYTARHHTFFEMLGNFSFGDYFKEQAILHAWTLVTREFGLPKDRLTVTVYSEDDDAHRLWQKIAGLPESRIIRIPTSDNFWRMGDTGPCGPCSEIFYDHGEHVPGGPPGSPDQDGDRFIEIWNLVFMQYEEQPGGARVGLPRPSIDTGMGLERVAAVMQGTHDNYAIDLFAALIRAVADATGVEPGGPHGVSHRVIADHLRCAAFLIADGVLPSNEGRGYVVRRIMRRGMRHAQLLGARDPLMWRLVPVLVREMGQAYPELVHAEALITETLRLEETRFRTTLARGLTMLDAETAGLASGDNLRGDVAFTLYDTYGFPLDLTQDALRARGIGVEQAGFDAAMLAQKTKARAAWSGSGEAATETVWFGVKDRSGATEFLGYDTEKAEGVVVALIHGGKDVQQLDEGQTGHVVVNQTPFYAESGGQLGDSGRMIGADVQITVTDTAKKLGAVFAHVVTVDKGMVKLGAPLELVVDHARRSSVRANHSATHLLHEALRQVLGGHVAQKGSMVSADRLRFDFSHPTPISDGDLATVEDIANRMIVQNGPVVTKLMDVDSAIESGARALFGEKYGDEVRVVSMGVDDTEARAGKPFSVELCGGTHVVRTGDIGLVTILAEGAVASGVRRVEALTGAAARQHLRQESQRLKEMSALLKSPAAEAAERLAVVLDERRRMERELSDARKKLAMGGGGSTEELARDISGVKFMGRVVSGVEMKDLKALVDEAKTRLGSGVVALIALDDAGKAGAVVGVTDDMTTRFDAVALVRIASDTLGGKGGGGRRDLAQAGGPDGAKAEAALESIAAAML
jgi:alanyl-tRNA synthetase